VLKNGLIWAFSLAIAAISGLTAMGAVAKDKAPALAVTLSPTNGFAAENIAAEFVKSAVAENRGQFPDRIETTATQFAQTAFIAEPVTPEAVAVLALGNHGGAKRALMKNALLLSRRQQLVNGWMIADSGARDDVPALLYHYDTMLRTSRSAASVVIPVMAGGLGNDKFVEPFVSLLAKQPPWARQFWGTVVRTPEAVSNAARLREALYKPNETDAAYSDAYLIRALIREQQFDQAQSLYRLLVRAKETGALLVNGSFDTEPEYAPIDWQLISTGEYGSSITGGTLQLSAIRNAGGLFARQLVKLPARTVKMDVNPDSPITDDAQIFLSLTCAQQLAKAPQPITISLKSKIENLQINNSQSGCSFYWLDINGRASENGNGFDIILNSIALR